MTWPYFKFSMYKQIRNDNKKNFLIVVVILPTYKLKSLSMAMSLGSQH